MRKTKGLQQRKPDILIDTVFIGQGGANIKITTLKTLTDQKQRCSEG